jgi:hypothetical protein
VAPRGSRSGTDLAHRGKSFSIQRIERSAAGVGDANFGGSFSRQVAALVSIVAVLGCAGQEREAKTFPHATGVAVHVARAPSSTERYCAWYGTEGADGVLYFGEAAFWSAKAKAGGDATADLQQPGPQLIGRFDLAAERWLPPLEVGTADSRSGVWDVLDGGDSEIYFTTFFEEAGSVQPATGRVRRLELGGALNELAHGPDGTVLASRYGSGSANAGDGDVIAFDRNGRIVRRWSLAAPPGYRVAPKTPLWDGLRSELWVTADQLPIAGVPGTDLAPRQDAIAVDASGHARLLPEPPEILFLAKGRDGEIYRAEADEQSLWLAIVPPRDAPRRVLLDDAFAPGLDFAQDIQVSADGRVVVTRWSGVVHVLERDGRVRSAALPRPDAAGLYYTGVLHGQRLCVTYCADVTVVCVDAP